MNYQLICSDIDGTLLDKNRELSAFTIQEIQRVSPIPSKASFIPRHYFKLEPPSKTLRCTPRRRSVEVVLAVHHTPTVRPY